MARPTSCALTSTCAASGSKCDLAASCGLAGLALIGPQTLSPEMRKRLILLLACWCVALPLAGCGGGSDAPQLADAASAPIVPAGSRPGVLAISAMPRLDPYPTSGEQYMSLAGEAFELGYGAGARGLMTTYRWTELEPDAKGYAPDKLKDWETALALTQSRGMVQYLGIQLINTTTRELPADIAGQAFDSAVVRARFHALLDKLIKPHKGQVKYLSIGNEVDAYLRANPTQWAPYQRFYEDALAYAHTLDPALQVGVTGTFDGALGQSPAELKALNARSDVLILTYYPLQYDAQFKVTVRDPSVVADDFKRMLALAGSRALVMQEVGYPASAENNSSPARQAAFVTELFAAWQAAGGRIPFVNVFLLHDFTPAMCEDFGVYYGIAGVSSFKAFLCSLGLRQADGTPREAWATLVAQAKAANLP
jgi:hypothetical protein